MTNWGGFTAHRYGDVRIKTIGPAIFKGQKRTAIIQRVADLLRDWEQNRWEKEATTRTAIRIALIHKGFPWAVSDAEAVGLVRAAFNTLGRGIESRPTFEEGQKYHTYGPGHCLHCFGPIDDNDRLKGRRFCCPEHARLALERFDFETTQSESEVGNHARYILRLDAAETRRCVIPGCGKEFQATRPDAVTCCPEHAALLPGLGLPDRWCRHCNGRFTPHHKDQQYCTREHHRQAKEQRKKAERHRKRDEAAEAECARDGCHNTFKPRRAMDLYCSEKCQRAAARQREKARKAKAA